MDHAGEPVRPQMRSPAPRNETVADRTNRLCTTAT